jgi:DNA replication protein DnaC
MTGFDWNFDARHPEAADALAGAIRYCAHLDERSGAIKAARIAGERRPDRPARWFTLLGPSGRGKTHLARKIAEWRKTRGSGKFFYRWLDLLTDFRTDRSNIGRFMVRADMPALLIIDDIGAGYETEFAAATLAEIAERRVGLPTVWTSNLDLGGIARIDARIASRMRRNGSEVFTFKSAPDFSLNPKP